MPPRSSRLPRTVRLRRVTTADPLSHPGASELVVGDREVFPVSHVEISYEQPGPPKVSVEFYVNEYVAKTDDGFTMVHLSEDQIPWVTRDAEEEDSDA